MKLQPGEKRLDGKWTVTNGNMLADDTCSRIEELIAQHLDRIASDASGWDTLYRDPDDGRYWELIYEQSDMHGGGPPSLVQVDVATPGVKAKYGLS
ncbi:MAG TPA: Imm27 family immunity protein [Polyangiaceae bacterium]